MKTKIGKNTNLRIFGDMIQLPCSCFDPYCSRKRSLFIHIYYSLYDAWLAQAFTDPLTLLLRITCIYHLFCFKMALDVCGLGVCGFLGTTASSSIYQGYKKIWIELGFVWLFCLLKFPYPLNVPDRAYAFLFHVPFADLWLIATEVHKVT
jgi:hypothetical protein